jgi:hypothetical protein
MGANAGIVAAESVAEMAMPIYLLVAGFLFGQIGKVG